MNELLCDSKFDFDLVGLAEGVVASVVERGAAVGLLAVHLVQDVLHDLVDGVGPEHHGHVLIVHHVSAS